VLSSFSLGVQLINAPLHPLWAQFHQRSTYEFFVQTYVLAAFATYVQLEKAAEMTYVQKTRTFYVDEIDTWLRYIPGNVRQHSTQRRGEHCLGPMTVAVSAISVCPHLINS